MRSALTTSNRSVVDTGAVALEATLETSNERISTLEMQVGSMEMASKVALGKEVRGRVNQVEE